MKAKIGCSSCFPSSSPGGGLGLPTFSLSLFSKTETLGIKLYPMRKGHFLCGILKTTQIIVKISLLINKICYKLIQQ